MLTADNLNHCRYKLAIELENHAFSPTLHKGRFSWDTGEVSFLYGLINLQQFYSPISTWFKF